jgi:hypothetical protein
MGELHFTGCYGEGNPSPLLGRDTLMFIGKAPIGAGPRVWDGTQRQEETGRSIPRDDSREVVAGVRRHEYSQQDGHDVGTTYELQGAGALYDQNGRKAQGPTG